MVFIVGNREQIHNYISMKNLEGDIEDIYYKIDIEFGHHDNIYFILEKNPNTGKISYYSEDDLEVIKDMFLDMDDSEVIYLNELEEQGELIPIEQQNGGVKSNKSKSNKIYIKKTLKNKNKKVKNNRKKSLKKSLKKRKNNKKTKSKRKVKSILKRNKKKGGNKRKITVKKVKFNV